MGTRTKRVVVAFAIEDRGSRDLLEGQSLNTNSPFEYIDMSVKAPWDREWKTKCHTRSKSCDGVIALLNRNSVSADGQKWEIICAKDEKIPLIGVYIYTSATSNLKEMDGVKQIHWTWDGIKDFLEGL